MLLALSIMATWCSGYHLCRSRGRPEFDSHFPHVVALLSKVLYSLSLFRYPRERLFAKTFAAKGQHLCESKQSASAGPASAGPGATSWSLVLGAGWPKGPRKGMGSSPMVIYDLAHIYFLLGFAFLQKTHLCICLVRPSGRPAVRISHSFSATIRARKLKFGRKVALSIPFDKFVLTVFNFLKS